MRLTCVPAQDVRAIPQTRVLCPKSAARSGVGTPGVAAQAWDASPNVRTSIIILWPPKNPPARFQSHTGFLVWDPTPRILCTVWGGIPHQRFPPKNRPVWDSPTAGVGSSSWVNINSLLLLRFLLLILLLLLLLFPFARRSGARLPYSIPTGGNRVCITKKGDLPLRLPTNRGR